MTTNAEKRQRAWTQMRRSHLRRSKLCVALAEARLTEARAALAAEEAERAAAAEYARGRRAYHLAMSLSDDDDERERARAALDCAESEHDEEHVEWLRARVRACETQLELDRRRHAELAAERRQEREFQKALRVVYGASARGVR